MFRPSWCLLSPWRSPVPSSRRKPGSSSCCCSGFSRRDEGIAPFRQPQRSFPSTSFQRKLESILRLPRRLASLAIGCGIARFRRPQRPPSHFSLNGQREVTKRKAARSCAPRDRAAGYASLRDPGSRAEQEQSRAAERRAGAKRLHLFPRFTGEDAEGRWGPNEAKAEHVSEESSSRRME
jgi:hypothetical protein